MAMLSKVKLFLTAYSLSIYCLLKHFFINVINFNFTEFIDLSTTMSQIGYWLKKSYVMSVDTTEIYHEKFNFNRYLIC